MVVKVDTTGWKNYIAEVRKHLPKNYEQAFHNSGLSYTSQAYIFHCFVTGVAVEDCASWMLASFTIIEDEAEVKND